MVNALTEATSKYWYVTSGGKLEGAMESFLLNKLDYRYMGPDLNSKKKLVDFLEDSYTLDAINAYIKRAGIVTHNGKLAQPNADGGSLLNYQKATVVAYRGNSNEKEFDLKVPLGTSLFYEYIHIEFKKRLLDGKSHPSQVHFSVTRGRFEATEKVVLKIQNNYL